MKKIDLHIHTKATILDNDFEFDFETLRAYVERMKLDLIAITNHNHFDYEQFSIIESNLDICVLPGIEISLEGGHLLLISDNNELEDFSVKCEKIEDNFKDKNDSIKFDVFKKIFPDLSRYLLIPHINKNPILNEGIIRKIGEHITAGEVSSIKKFMYAIKDDEEFVPMLFSDIRISNEVKFNKVASRQTYIDLENINFSGLKLCLNDKAKISLSRHEGHEYFEVLENGLSLSTGLNVLIGERSSGKSYTLGKINESLKNVKYIEQFSLLERDEEKEKEKFNKLLKVKQSHVTEDYLREFKNVVDDVINIDIQNDLQEIDKYLISLKKFAFEQEKSDCFSKAKLFNESLYNEKNIDNLKSLIESTKLLFENTEYRSIIDKYISKSSISKLVVELINKYIKEYEINLKKRWCNELIENIKKELDIRTATTQIKDTNFFDFAMNKKRIEKFIYLTDLVKEEKEIVRKNIQGFNVVASTKKFNGAQELKNQSKSRAAFTPAFEVYEQSYEYLQKLKEVELLENTEIFKYFINIKYSILNQDNVEVSGGERSEYNLLQQINDSLDYDILLIDEPESSFDNLFLKNNVNELIKSISTKIPVVVVTHNNTIGASIKPDYILYTKKYRVDGKAEYKIFSGYPSDKELTSIDGKKIENINVIYDCLEAGKVAYIERGQTYEILENK